MSNTKFTPGPWETEISHAREHGNYPRILVGKGNTLTANCYNEKLVTCEMEANAKLIAAAPELLNNLEAACNTIIRAVELLVDFSNNSAEEVHSYSNVKSILDDVDKFNELLKKIEE